MRRVGEGEEGGGARGVGGEWERGERVGGRVGGRVFAEGVM